MAKAVAAKESSNGIVTFDASIFEQDAGKGLENMGQDDLALPFLKVLSRQDPTLDDLEGAKAGDILNTVSNQVYSGKTGIRVIPCHYQRRFVEWAPRGSGSGAPLNIYTPEDSRPQTERGDDNKRERDVSRRNAPAFCVDSGARRYDHYRVDPDESDPA